MPYIKTRVSVSMTEAQSETLKSKFGKIIEIIPGKTESWLMVGFEDNYSLYFKGKNDTKLAYVEVKIFGGTTDEAYDKLTARLCQIYEEVLGIPQDKIYIKYEEVEHWGWNGANF